MKVLCVYDYSWQCIAGHLLSITLFAIIEYFVLLHEAFQVRVDGYYFFLSSSLFYFKSKESNIEMGFFFFLNFCQQANELHLESETISILYQETTNQLSLSAHTEELE